MYLSFYPIGTSGHRASALMGFVPYHNYGAPAYGNPANYAPAPMAPVAAQYAPAPAPAFDGQSRAPAHVGGISAVLDYDAARMAAFMCWCTFGMLGQARTPTPQLEASVVSILHATRLPKLTIVIALEYINQRYAACAHLSMPELDVFVKLVVALVLANKFNDDNTFTNKSWFGASGVKVAVLNALEREWLAAVNWNLNVVHFQSNIETLEECWVSWSHKQAHQPCYFAQPPSAPASDNYGSFSSVPSSPLYDSASVSSMYGYSLPVSASPAKFSQDWGVPGPQNFHYLRPGQYTSYAPQPSIWAYPPTTYPSMPPLMDSAYAGLSNPYYNCLATY
ncbi:hypothetical protein METBIDRAFT_10347 [Metschnikowia bicuspidata var. bicuspidata NRRL YB-4993]|uniref:Cyclin N-terminal domain-containing protein n=1 Tax=Metschnikowia bicuspidata var. bicuspidata NRRL YB-4993 TaxID=869754 RepID=A0A1A0HJX6_9ASCO|nr:hypothetical protein METBIDRAFT_10347 [Metschnikowia bicuspidata var. bicuspidata NRRL YB-4993]OBA24187.1 hypothetical protein METBIDRAFT_10347 [Metschnikowia bicuspidata var. bicuspidata NRRL YB-4993]